MAILLINNHPLPSENEFEIFSKEGFTVDIVYGPLGKGQAPERIKNVTEIHWLFRDDDRGSVAVESDIDSSGRTIYVNWIQFMAITGSVQVK